MSEPSLPEGTFDAIIPRLPELRELGVNALELLPVAQFPGDRNWGYDGVYPGRRSDSYGGVEGLKRLVDACHREGLAVIMDVVYNHLGPEGELSVGAGNLFHQSLHPLGRCRQLRGPHSPGVREYVVGNARYWFETCHLRRAALDAIHAIYDFGARHILSKLAKPSLTADNAKAGLSISSPRAISTTRVSCARPPPAVTGWTGNGATIFITRCTPFLPANATATTRTSVPWNSWRKSIADPLSTLGTTPHRQRFHGDDPDDCPAWRFVVCSQNHDQVGNRALGERLSGLLPFPALNWRRRRRCCRPTCRCCSWAREYGEPRPFLYFISHGDPALIEGCEKVENRVCRLPRRGRGARSAVRGDVRGFQAAMGSGQNRPTRSITRLLSRIAVVVGKRRRCFAWTTPA